MGILAKLRRIPPMKTRDLFSVSLPPIAVGLGSRVERLHSNGLQMSIYARNFIAPTFLKVMKTGLRNLALATFNTKVSTKAAIRAIKNSRGYSLALVEDFLVTLEHSGCTKALTAAIVCPAAQFHHPDDGVLLTPYAVLGNNIREHNVGLAKEEDVSWSPGIGFLVVKR